MPNKFKAQKTLKSRWLTSDIKFKLLHTGCPMRSGILKGINKKQDQHLTNVVYLRVYTTWRKSCILLISFMQEKNTSFWGQKQTKVVSLKEFPKRSPDHICCNNLHFSNIICQLA